MAPTPPQGPTDGSRSVQAHENQASGASIMAMAPSGHISTAPNGVKTGVGGNFYLTINSGTSSSHNTNEHQSSSSISPPGPGPLAFQGGEISPFSPSLERGLTVHSEPPPEIEGPGTGLAMPPSLPIPTSTTLTGYKECFSTVEHSVSATYDTLYHTLRYRSKRVVRSKKHRRQLYEEIETQRSDYQMNNTSLTVALSNIRNTMDHGGTSTIGTCQQIYSALCALWDQLHQVLSLFKAVASIDACEVSAPAVRAQPLIEHHLTYYPP